MGTLLGLEVSYNVVSNMKSFLLLLSVLICISVSQGCGSSQQTEDILSCVFTFGVKCPLGREAPVPWDKALKDMSQRIDRAIPELGLLNNGQTNPRFAPPDGSSLDLVF